MCDVNLRIIIAGSRSFYDYDFAKEKIDEVIAKYPNSSVEIISGGAKGADSLGIQYAQEHDIELTVYYAQWANYGKSAGFIRNTQMAQWAKERGSKGILIAFWDGESRGTSHMVNIAKKKKIKTYIFYPGKEFDNG
jgi:hypothetical protein